MRFIMASKSADENAFSLPSAEMPSDCHRQTNVTIWHSS
jgi:hypothetical protein